MKVCLQNQKSRWPAARGKEGSVEWRPRREPQDTGLLLREEDLRRSSGKCLHQLQALLESPSDGQAPQNRWWVLRGHEISDSAGDTQCHMEFTQGRDHVWFGSMEFLGVLTSCGVRAAATWTGCIAGSVGCPSWSRLAEKGRVRASQGRQLARTSLEFQAGELQSLENRSKPV